MEDKKRIKVIVEIVLLVLVTLYVVINLVYIFLPTQQTQATNQPYQSQR